MRPRASATAWCSVASSIPSTVRSLEKVGFMLQLYPLHRLFSRPPREKEPQQTGRRQRHQPEERHRQEIAAGEPPAELLQERRSLQAEEAEQHGEAEGDSRRLSPDGRPELPSSLL